MATNTRSMAQKGGNNKSAKAERKLRNRPGLRQLKPDSPNHREKHDLRKRARKQRQKLKMGKGNGNGNSDDTVATTPIESPEKGISSSSPSSNYSAVNRKKVVSSSSSSSNYSTMNSKKNVSSYNLRSNHSAVNSKKDVPSSSPSSNRNAVKNKRSKKPQHNFSLCHICSRYNRPCHTVGQPLRAFADSTQGIINVATMLSYVAAKLQF